jgi:hypothetical protein
VGDTAEFSTGLLNPHGPVPALVKHQSERRYNVYRNNVAVGLIKALEANFPVVRRLLGEHYFAGFARDFAYSTPPQSPLMFHYGADLPKALADANDLTHYPYLSDMAQLEILWRESYHAADAAPLAGDVLASIDPDVLFDCRFKIHPATRLFQSRFAVQSIFLANRSEGVDMHFDPFVPQYVLIKRPRYEVTIVAITSEQYGFFLALQKGESLGQAFEHTADLDPNFDLSGTLALMLQSGAFHSIETGNPASP